MRSDRRRTRRTGKDAGISRQHERGEKKRQHERSKKKRKGKQKIIKSTHYRWIKAYIKNGHLRWRYQVAGNPTAGRMFHVESVIDRTTSEIEIYTKEALSIDDDDPVEIEIIYE